MSLATAEATGSRRVEIRLFGEIVASVDGVDVAIAARAQRRVLALLALHAGVPVAVSALVHVLWPEEPPPTAIASLQNHISRLRAVLGTDVIATRAPGYALELHPTTSTSCASSAWR